MVVLGEEMRFFKLNSIANEVDKCIEQSKETTSICAMGSIDRMEKIKHELHRRGHTSKVHTIDGRVYHICVDPRR